MYNAIDIAAYIINYSNQKSYEISVLRLQKLLYFVQAWFLSTTGKPCFVDDFEAWSFGPVIPRVYHEFIQYGFGSLPVVMEYYEVTEDYYVIKKQFGSIRRKDRRRINKVVSGLSDYPTAILTNIILTQRPWSDAYQGRGIITKKSIQNYFK